MASELLQKLGGLPSFKDGKESEKKLDMSQEEAKRLEECFKDRKFRDLLAAYCDEIANPKTRMAYEEYLRQVEQQSEQPTNRKLVKPKAGFVIKCRKDPKKMNLTKKQGKTEILKNNVSLKVFINCCFADSIDDAKLAPNKADTRPINSTGDERAGICWQIPYILGHVRPEKDMVGNFCEVVDIAFSENTIKTCKRDSRFNQIVIQTAIEAVEANAGFKFHKKYKILKNIDAKGEPAIMSINTSKTPTLKEALNKKSGSETTTFIDKDKAQKISKELKKNKASKHKSKIKSNKRKYKNKNQDNNNTSNKNDPCTVDNSNVDYTISSSNTDKIEEIDEKSEEIRIVSPEYRIVESGDMNLQEYWSDTSLIVAPVRRPERLIVKITLPSLRNINNINADIINQNDENSENGGKLLQYLEIIEKNSNNNSRNERYYLKVKLPYTVITSDTCDINNSVNSNFSNISAHWYGVTKELHVTLKVKPFSKEEMNALKEKMGQMKAKTSDNNEISIKTDSSNENGKRDSEEPPKKRRKLDNQPNKDNHKKKNQTEECNISNNDTIITNINDNNLMNTNDANSNEVTAIDEILKLNLNPNKIEQKDTVHITESKNQNNVNQEKTGPTPPIELSKESNKVKKKNVKKMKQKGAVKAGFLLSMGDKDGMNESNGNDTLNKHDNDINNELGGIKEMSLYDYEFRERLNRIVLVYRVSNIIESSVNINFNEFDISISFETENSAFYKKINLNDEIDCKQCSFDVNSRNLLIMLMKKEAKMWDQVEKKEKIDIEMNSDNIPSVINCNDNDNDNDKETNDGDNKENILDALLNDVSTLDLE